MLIMHVGKNILILLEVAFCNKFFAETESYPNEVTQLKDVLTAEALKTFAEILKSTKV